MPSYVARPNTSVPKFVISSSAPSVQSCTISDNGVYGIQASNASGAHIGAQNSPNNFANNPFANLRNETSGEIVQAQYNYWGATSEDSVVKTLSGSIAYSPWMNAAHTATYASTRWS